MEEEASFCLRHCRFESLALAVNACRDPRIKMPHVPAFNCSPALQRRSVPPRAPTIRSPAIRPTTPVQARDIAPARPTPHPQTSASARFARFSTKDRPHASSRVTCRGSEIPNTAMSATVPMIASR